MRRFTPVAIALAASVALPASAPADAGHTAPTPTPNPGPAAMPAPSMSSGPRASKRAMSVRADVARDSMSGWNLHVRAKGFTWTPKQASTAAKPGGGHAHVYVDGKKVGRLYGPWLHLPAMTPGKHTVKVELNANDHRAWVWKGKAVSTTVDITEPMPMDAMPMHPHPAIPATEPLGVGLSVRKDAMAGWNVSVVTTGFRLTPAAANTAPAPGTGHFHLYVDGVKIGRLYTRHYHLSTALEPGPHRVTVSLNANDHSPWSLDGQDVTASQTITVPAA